MDLLVGALLLRRVFQGTPSHQRRSDLWTGGQQFNGLPQESSLASQFDSQSQSQQLVLLALLSFSLVCNQIPNYISSALCSLHAWLLRIPHTLKLLLGKMWRTDVDAARPAQRQQLRSSRLWPGRATADRQHEVDCASADHPAAAESKKSRGNGTGMVDGQRAGVCLNTMALFHTPRKERERKNRVPNEEGPGGWERGRSLLSGPLLTAQQLCEAGSIEQALPLELGAHSH